MYWDQVIKSVFARRNGENATERTAWTFSPRRYAASVWRDTRLSLGRVRNDWTALLAIAVFVLPWLSLFWLRHNYDWLQSFAEIAFFGFLFWWMSRSGGAAAPDIKYPALELILALCLVLVWVGWRIGICANVFPFLPPNLNCYQSPEYDIAPKLVENVVIPGAILLALGYRWRALGVQWSWRAWWITLPALMVAAAVGLYLHQKQPFGFVQGTGNFIVGAGLPEEFLFRMVLLTRLEGWMKNSSWSLLAASVIFGLSHLPIDYLVFTKHDWRETWITALTFQMGYGFVFAFAYQRIRNIWPLALLHGMVDAM